MAGDVEIEMDGGGDAISHWLHCSTVVLVDIGGGSGLHHCTHGVSERIETQEICANFWGMCDYISMLKIFLNTHHQAAWSPSSSSSFVLGLNGFTGAAQKIKILLSGLDGPNGTSTTTTSTNTAMQSTTNNHSTT